MCSPKGARKRNRGRFKSQKSVTSAGGEEDWQPCCGGKVKKKGGQNWAWETRYRRGFSGGGVGRRREKKGGWRRRGPRTRRKKNLEEEESGRERKAKKKSSEVGCKGDGISGL